jgi:hypothetical protein
MALAFAGAGCASQPRTAKLLDTLDETASLGAATHVPELPASLFVLAGWDVIDADLSAVAGRFGASAIHRVTAREGAPVGICYDTPNAAILFRAGALGGWQRVTGYTVIRHGSNAYPTRCDASALLPQGLALRADSLLDARQLVRELRQPVLSPNGLIATDDLQEGGRRVTRIRAVTYGRSAAGQLEWVDVSSVIDR